MTAQEQGRGGTPEDPDGTPRIPDEVWLQFLQDDESSIRASAPREPSAQERASGLSLGFQDTRRTERPVTRSYDDRPLMEAEAVGDLWQPTDPWPGPHWRDMDGRARLRRIGRVIVTAAAIALALGLWSELSTGAGTGAEEPTETTVQRLEEPSEAPSAGTPLPPGPTTSPRAT